MQFAGNQQCQVCGGESFTTSHGLKVCDQCGRQEEHYIELQSQETIGEVDRSRLIKTRNQENEGEVSAPLPHDEQLSNWTTYEAYNFILYEWTKALLKLGASPKLEAVTFKLWAAYLHRMGIAFQTNKKFCKSSLKNSRDKKLIYENAESVAGSSLHSYRRRWKKKKAKPTKLDKIKDKIEWKKMKNEIKKKQDSSFMNSTLANVLSKSLDEFEASMLSDSCTSVSSLHSGRSNMNMSDTSELTSVVDENSHMSILNSGSDMERDGTSKVQRKQVRRDTVVKSWIRRTAHMYKSELEEEEQQEEEGEMGKEKIGEEETVEEGGDEDCGSEARVKKSTKPKGGDISSKESRRIPRIRKHDKSKHLRDAVKASGQITSYRASRLPFIMNFSKLLAILYLAVLLAEEDLLLSDIIRWCREGHIPYLSAPYLLHAGMEVSYYDLTVLRNSKNLPDAQEVQAMAGRLAVFLSIQYVPLPSVGSIVRKFVKLLNLPEDVTVVAESLIKLVDDMKVGLAVPPVESMAMASIILALKVYCGLDGHTEIMLSHAATVITNEMPNHISVTPFSWQDWQKHISRLVWVCCHVDPPTAFHWQSLHDVCYFNSEVFSKFFWREGMWRIPRTSCKKKAKLQILIEELLQQQGVTLEQVVMQSPLFEASQQPLHSTIEQLLQRDHATETKEMQGFIKVAEELKEESFAKHSLNWMENVDNIALELNRCGSKTKLHLSRGQRKASTKDTENPNRVQTSDYENVWGMKENVLNASQVLFIPHPLKRFWKIKQQKYATWEKLSPSLPHSFRWLIGVGSSVCETPKMQILSLLCLLQGKFRIKTLQ